jgi:pimeloyl-ACP methyl ester carboxylesterase
LPRESQPISDLDKDQSKPILLIVGEEEQWYTQAAGQLAGSGANAVLWIIPNTGHWGYLKAGGLLIITSLPGIRISGTLLVS